jgi:hypothetical protein
MTDTATRYLEEQFDISADNRGLDSSETHQDGSGRVQKTMRK